ncbi:MAG TPA: class II aldolase/adducin family protein [Gammaproteobacteria bacterium]|nr:class II aldolase/adducin family protein [Gammaproteobacteria bacterium]
MTIKPDLALAYRILAHLKWDDHTYTHLSARDPNDANAFYIYPFGLKFEEVTADQLLRVSLDGEILEGQEFQYNRTGYIIHGNIYKHRPDLNAVFHLHTPESVAVSVQPAGLLPISQWALHFYNRVSYHGYDSLALVHDQGRQLIQDLGENKVMLLRHHGLVTCGATLQEALFYVYHLQKACEAQCLILAMNQPYLTPSPEVCEKAVRDLLSFEKNLGERDWLAWERVVGS